MEVPDELALRARALAAATYRRFEDAILDWLRRVVEEPRVETLPDREVLALCDATLAPVELEALSHLLAGHRERTLSSPEKGEPRLPDGHLPARAGPEGTGPEGCRGPRAPAAARRRSRMIVCRSTSSAASERPPGTVAGTASLWCQAKRFNAQTRCQIKSELSAAGLATSSAWE